jgi:hypothetical protein
MKVINLGEFNSILNKFVAQMRDKDVQKDSMRFRRNLERLGEIFAYEISKLMVSSHKDVVTPLGIASVPTFVSYCVILESIETLPPLCTLVSFAEALFPIITISPPSIRVPRADPSVSIINVEFLLTSKPEAFFELSIEPV